MFQENDQGSGKEYSTIVQIIMKDDCEKVIAWRTVSCKMTCYHVSDKKKNVQILSLHFVLTTLVVLFLFEWASSLDQNIDVKKNFIETILVAMIEMWNLYWSAPKDKCNDNAMITLYQLKTNINAQLTKKAAFDALLGGLSMSWNEPPTSPLGVNILASWFKLLFQKFRNVIWGYYFYKTIQTFYFFPHEFLSFIKINFDFH